MWAQLRSVRKMLFGEAESVAAPGADRAPLAPQPLQVGKSPSAEETVALPDPHRGRAVVMLILAIVISVAVILLSARFRDALLAFGQLGLIGLFVLSVVGNATVLIPAPVFVVACAAAPIYGILATGIVSGIGSAVGEMTGYMAGYGGTAVLPQGKIYQRMHNLMERFGPLVIFVLALLPNPMFDVGGLIAGILKMHPFTFFLATAAGKAIRLTLVALACNGGLPLLTQFIDPYQAP